MGQNDIPEIDSCMSKNLMYGKSIDSSQWGKLDQLISCPNVTGHPLW